MNLADRMRTAADTLEEASALYGYPHPEHASWSPLELRLEAKHVETDTGLFDGIGKGGPW